MNTQSTFISDPLAQELPEGVELSGFYSSVVDLITAGHRGKAVTWALNGTDLSTDPAALQQAYQQNPAALNDYFNYVDIDKLVRKITGGNDPNATQGPLDWILPRIPALLVGAAVGAGAIAFLK